MNNYTLRFEALLDAFQDYTAASPYFDILFYPHIGYIYLGLEPNDIHAYRIKHPDRLFEIFIRNICNDVRDLFLCGEHFAEYLFPDEIPMCRARLLPYIDRMPDSLKTLCTAQMEFFFEHCNDLYLKKGGTSGTTGTHFSNIP